MSRFQFNNTDETWRALHASNIWNMDGSNNMSISGNTNDYYPYGLRINEVLTNKQYIDTKIVPDGNKRVRFIVDYTYLNNVTFGYHGIYNPTKQTFYIGEYYTTLRFQALPAARQDNLLFFSLNKRYNLTLDYNPYTGILSGYDGNSLIQSTTIGGIYDNSSNLSLWIGGANEVSQANSIYCNCILWKAVILFDDKLVFNGIPVQTGNTVFSPIPAPSNCLFDMVTKTYFENQGLGSFGIVNKTETGDTQNSIPSTVLQAPEVIVNEL